MTDKELDIKIREAEARVVAIDRRLQRQVDDLAVVARRQARTTAMWGGVAAGAVVLLLAVGQTVRYVRHRHDPPPPTPGRYDRRFVNYDDPHFYDARDRRPRRQEKDWVTRVWRLLPKLALLWRGVDQAGAALAVLQRRQRRR